MATLTVTNTNDTGAGSLRAAIASANTNVDADTIVFAQGLAGQTIALTALSGNLVITQGTLTINGDLNGDGDADITISGGNVTDILNIAGPANVTLNSLVLTGGKSDGFSSNGIPAAGAISNAGTLHINYSVISNNTANAGEPYTSSGFGAQGVSAAGAIVNSGYLGITQSVFENNSAMGVNGAAGETPGYAGAGIGGNGGNGGHAASDILNLASGSLGFNRVAMLQGSATGGNGGDGGNGSSFGAANYHGGNGGNGGNAAAGFINFGYVNGIVKTTFTALGIGFGGAAGAGTGAEGSGFAGTDGTNHNSNWQAGAGAFNDTALMGTQNGDVVHFTGQNLRFDGLGGDDNIDDSYFAGNFSNFLYGGAGNDIIRSKQIGVGKGGLGNDLLVDAGMHGGIWDGGDGVDTFSIQQFYFTDVNATINLQTQVASDGFNITSILNFENAIGRNVAGHSDIITGTTGVNVLSGLAGEDTLIGLEGGDDLSGGEGNDILEGGAGADHLDGGGNTATGDTLAYAGSSAGVIVNLALNAASLGDAAGDLISNFENVTGSSFDDQLTGSAVANRLDGGAGDDTFRAWAGADTFIGGAQGALGDTLWFDGWGSGVNINLELTTAQAVSGGSVTLSGIENIIGSSGADTLRGTNGANRLEGGAGDDSFRAWAGADSFFGGANGASGDTLRFDSWSSGVNINLDLTTAQTVAGGSVTLTGIENMIGGNGADTLRGTNAANRLDGAGGDDTFKAWAGADTFIGGAHGAAGDTLWFDGWGTGVIVNLGLATAQAVSGGSVTLSGIENVRGGNGADNLTGDGNANVITGGKGADTLTGGLGSDTFRFAAGDSGQTATTLDIITDFTKGAVGVGDEIDYTTLLSIGGSAAAATATEASINGSTGVASFAAGQGTTLNDALSDIATRMTAATNSAGEFAFFRVNGTGNEMLFISDGIAGVSTNDVVVQLNNITSVNSISLSGGDITILT
jgi:Ca2+-binding RTX toxin-like protein